MYSIKQTTVFTKWLTKLKNIQGKVAILRRIERIKNGNFGEYKPLGDNVSELKIAMGAGYRVYYTKIKDDIVIFLIGGDKSSQDKDIKKAKQLCRELRK